MNNWQDWVEINWTETVMTIVSTAVLYAAIVAFVRLTGLRSFSKMSAFDFAMTLAIGSLFASSISGPDPTVLVALVAFSALFAGQKAVAHCRRNAGFRRMVDNDPVLLMRNGALIDENMRRCGVTRSDIAAKLREANALSLDRVHAVVFETTGDISVLHGEPDQSPDPMLLEGVLDASA